MLPPGYAAHMSHGAEHITRFGNGGKVPSVSFAILCLFFMLPRGVYDSPDPCDFLTLQGSVRLMDIHHVELVQPMEVSQGEQAY